MQSAHDSVILMLITIIITEPALGLLDVAYLTFTEFLGELITDSHESAFERSILPRGIENWLAKTDW